MMRILDKENWGLLVVTLFFTIIGYTQNLVPGGIDSGEDLTLDCTTGSCTTLVADFLQSHVTDSRYTVESIPMDPVNVSLPSQLDVDDAYSEIIDLDGNSADNFVFCYFGDVYEEIQIGDNGTVSFDLGYPPGVALSAEFQLLGNIPDPQLPLNSVFGAFHDLLIPTGGGLVTYGVTGTAPFRAFVINYRNVPHFGCSTITTTQQIVLHETSNFIDVYITEKPVTCSGAAEEQAAIGIQNFDGTEGYFAPNRNTGIWSATEEAWRFAPVETGDETFTFEWVNNTTGMVESNSPDYNICPTETTTYTANVTWVNCVGATETANDEVTITVDLPFTLEIDEDQEFCVGDGPYTITTTATVSGGVTIVSYNWYEASNPSTSLGASDTLTVNTTGTYLVDVEDSGGCIITQEIDVIYNSLANAGGDNPISFCSSDSPVDLFTILGGTPDSGGTWSPALSGGDIGTFDPSVDTAGDYIYTVLGNGCPDAFATITVTIDTAPDAGTDNTIAFCSTDTSANLYDALGGADTGGTWSPVLSGGDLGTFDPSVDAAGAYIYTVTSTVGACSDATATITVTIDTPPNAGGDNPISFCSSDASVDLFTILGGSPDSGGTWSPSLSGGDLGTFNPSVDAAGDYTYTVTNGVCSPDEAIISVAVDTAPNAGGDNPISFCSSDAPVDLFTILGGTPDSGGTWSPALSGGDLGTFDPSVDTAGDYTYAVLGIGTCADALAIITVTVDTVPDAGGDNPISFCSSDASVDLFAILGGSPDTGGTWSPALSGGDLGTFDPSVDAAGDYTYTVTNGACSPDDAVISVAVDIAPNAGGDNPISFCSSDTPVDLFTILGGSPDSGGTWSPALSGGDLGTFDPLVDTAGDYTYTVTNGVCSPDDAVISVAVDIAPNAGGDNPISFCSSNTPVDLFTILGGTPDSGGTWSPALSGGDLGTFDPSVDPSGDYTYTVAGIGACTDATAIISVTVDVAPNAGINGVIAFCTSDGTTNLFDSLLGTPDTGGIWSPALSGGDLGIFDPSVDVAGDYTYTVINGICSPDEAIISVTVDISSDAGEDNSITFCSTDASTNLFTILGGTPDLGGTWSPALSGGDLGTFDPSVDATGDYTYTVLGNGVCPDVSATISVAIDVAPNAGLDVNIEFCSTDTTIDLFTILGGSPDLGGTWSPALSGGDLGTFDPSTNTTGVYNYIVSNGVCTDDIAEVDVTVYQAPDAGISDSIDFCNTDLGADLFKVLGGTPDDGGTWSPALASGTGDFNPSIDLGGTYTYTVLGTGTCDDTFATVEVIVGIAPNAGESNNAFFCMVEPPENLFSLLGGTPDVGGTWSPALSGGDLGTFNPSVDAAGEYTYTVLGSGSCEDVSATITVSLSEAPIITNIDIADFSDNNIVTVEVEGNVSATPFGIGDYEYSLDGINFQSDNIIENVPPGNYALTVRDRNGCGPSAFKNISVIGAPRFFTPNNDSYNDTWHIINLGTTDIESTSEVNIFDRFGKQIITLTAESEGWDGYYNGNPLPSGDYWYNVRYVDSDGNPIIKKGHFSLIRR